MSNISLSVATHLPASKDRLEVYREAQLADPTCTAARNYYATGWPRQQMLTNNLLPYWKVRGELRIFCYMEAGLLYLLSCREKPFTKYTKATREFRNVVSEYHPLCGGQESLKLWKLTYIMNCPQCLKSYIPPKEPLLSSPLPSRPWQKVAVDLFELNKSHYLLVIDYFSRFPEVFKINSATSSSIVSVLKSTFAHHGVPSILFTDNGPQFSSQYLKEFASAYSFRHITSSPRYSQGNGLVERTVGTVKKLLQHAMHGSLYGYPQLSLHTTPMVHADLPQTDHYLAPQWT